MYLPVFTPLITKVMKKMLLLTAMLLVWLMPDAKAWWWFDKYPSKYEASKARDKWIEKGGEVLQRKEGQRIIKNDSYLGRQN